MATISSTDFLRDVGILTRNLRSRIPMIFDITHVQKQPWVPPLYLLINPRTLERNGAKRVTTQKTRGGWVEFHWGDELDTLTANGSTPAFLLPPPPQIPLPPIPPIPLPPNPIATSIGVPQLPSMGLASGSKKPFVNRTSSAGYMNFSALFDIYRSNGLVYDELGVPIKLGQIRLTYDSFQYSGYFENFNYTESDGHPYRFDISFTFKVQTTRGVLSPGFPI